MDNIIIRKLTRLDYIGVRKVDILTQKQYQGSKWDSLSKIEKEKCLVSRKEEFNINVNSGYSFVALLKTEIVGFIFAFETQPFPGNIYIRYIGIIPKYQGYGIGLLLYKGLIKEASKKNIKKITALINLDNPNSMQLHEKVGFTLKDRKEAVLDLEKS